MEKRSVRVPNGATIVKVAIAVIVVVLVWLYLKPRFAGDVAVSSVAFTVGRVAVYWYGLIIAAAILAGYEFLVKPRIDKLGIDENNFATYVLVLVFLGLLGARLGFILQNVAYYKDNPAEILALWHGGLSIHGGIVAGFLTTLWYARYLKLSMWRVLDIIAPAVALGLALGRFGNFFNQELIGKVATVPWKMYVAPDLRPAALSSSEFFHPAFLYESLLDVVILIVLLRIAKNTKKEGLVFFAFVGFYSIVRFIVEFWRYNDHYVLWGLTLAQIVSIVLIVVSGCAFWMLRREQDEKPKNIPLPRMN